MAQKKGNGFTVIGDIQADIVVAAISDGNSTQTCISGETGRIIEVYSRMVSSVAQVLAGSVREEKQDQRMQIVLETMIKETINGVAMFFANEDEDKEEE